MNLSIYSAPIADARFLRLPDAMRDLVSQRLRAMQRIAAAAKPSLAIREIAAARRGERGWARATLTNLWYRFRKFPVWETLLDKARTGRHWWSAGSEMCLPAPFTEHLGKKWSERQRGKFRPVWAELKSQYRRWQSGDPSAAIPGYAACPPARADTGLPTGWSYSNLKRAADKSADAYSRLLIRIGPKAASQLTAKIFTTREGIPVGKVFLFDDCWADFRVLYRGKGCRLLSLHALDLASGCNILRGYKPAAPDETGLEQRIKEREMVFLVASLLSTIGFRRDGTVFICEMGTATVRQREKQMLYDLSGEAITVETGPAGGGPGIAGLFAERGGGNPRWKALDRITEFCNTRDDHRLEGWRECGNYMPAFRLDTQLPWLPHTMLDRLTPEQQSHVQTLLRANPDLTGEMCLTPRQVFDAGKSDLVKFTPAQNAMLLAGVEGADRPVTRGLLEVGVPECNPDSPLRYGPIVKDCQGREEPLRAGDKYLVRVNPYAPDRAWLYDARGGWIGYTPIWRAPDRLDEEALKESFKENSAASNAAVIAAAVNEKNDFAEAVRAALLRAAEGAE